MIEPEEIIAYEAIEIYRRQVVLESLRWKAEVPCVGISPWAEANKVFDSQAFANNYCANCPKTTECLNIALVFRDDQDIIYGGLGAAERRSLIDDLCADRPDAYRFFDQEVKDIIYATAARATAQSALREGPVIETLDVREVNRCENNNISSEPLSATQNA